LESDLKIVQKLYDLLGCFLWKYRGTPRETFYSSIIIILL
jgi:hypothetical protein